MPAWPRKTHICNYRGPILLVSRFQGISLLPGKAGRPSALQFWAGFFSQNGPVLCNVAAANGRWRLHESQPLVDTGAEQHLPRVVDELDGPIQGYRCISSATSRLSGTRSGRQWS